jgi:hypothetical protein
MSLLKKTVTYGEWKKLSAVGEDGRVWMGKFLGSRKPNILIAHTDSVQTGGSPTGDNIPWATGVDLDKAITYLLPLDGRISDPLYADNGNDIYYATIVDSGQSVELIVDFG